MNDIQIGDYITGSNYIIDWVGRVEKIENNEIFCVTLPKYQMYEIKEKINFDLQVLEHHIKIKLLTVVPKIKGLLLYERN